MRTHHTLPLALIIAALCAWPGSATAQVRWGRTGGFSLGHKYAEHIDIINPYTGLPGTYTYLPDSAVHPQGGLFVDLMRRYVGIRLSSVWMRGGEVDLTRGGLDVVYCDGVPCDDPSLHGVHTQYIATDFDVIVRPSKPDPRGFPMTIYGLIGPGARIRLNNKDVSTDISDAERLTGTLAVGGGFEFVFPTTRSFFVEFRHYQGLGTGGKSVSVFHAPNLEVRNVIRFGLTL